MFLLISLDTFIQTDRIVGLKSPAYLRGTADVAAREAVEPSGGAPVEVYQAVPRTSAL
jgi:hypothetical protein